MRDRAVDWDGAAVTLIDQTRLPGDQVLLRIDNVDDLIDAIRRLAVRGAPALGVAGALGVVVVLDQAEREGWSKPTRDEAISRLRSCRPTAVNLAWAVDEVSPLIDTHGRDAVLEAALRLRDDDETANRTLSRLGVDWLLQRVSAPVRVLTHCNAGALATSGWGTALGLVRELAARDALGLVYADETRPLLQGARLTAWELAAEGFEHVVQADAAAAGTILGGLVDAAIVGADRIARNGDTANKVGTLGVALACADAGIPFIVAAPWSTVDVATATGADIVIEARDPREVEEFAGVRVVPEMTRGHNPAFDVTPSRLISAIVTERSVVQPGPDTDLSDG